MRGANALGYRACRCRVRAAFCPARRNPSLPFVRTAFSAALCKEERPRLLAAPFVCRERADFEAVDLLSLCKAFSVARERLARYVPFARKTPDQVPFSLFSHPIRRTACLGSPQLHASTACFRQANRNRLLWRPRSVLSLAHVMKLLAHKLPRLCRRRFSLFFIALCSFDCFLFRHNRYPPSCGRARQFETIPASYSGQVGRFLYGCKVCL